MTMLLVVTSAALMLLGLVGLTVARTSLYPKPRLEVTAALLIGVGCVIAAAPFLLVFSASVAREFSGVL